MKINNKHWVDFLEKAKEIVSAGSSKVILKTDCYNELLGLPIEGGIAFNVGADEVRMIEFQDVHVYAARNRGMQVEHGDIRELPYENDYFDFVLDMSTIDHIPFADVGRVLGEYSRVLKERGKLVLAVWISESELVSEVGSKNTWTALNQYFFDDKKFEKSMDWNFNILEKENMTDGEDTYLRLYVCRNAKQGKS
jgi:SAM-dependent methyltransferase